MLSFKVLLLCLSLTDQVILHDHRDHGDQSRSIKSSLDSVLREVKLKLKNIFSGQRRVEIQKKSRLIATPRESMLPESWLMDDQDYFYIPDIPRDVEVQIEDLNQRWEEGNTIADIDRDSFIRPRKTKVKKKQRLKTRFRDRRNETKSDSKIYFTQIIKDRPMRIEEEKLSKSKKYANQEINDTTDILDSYSPYIYAELLKENQTNYVVIENLTNKNSNKSVSVIENEIDVYVQTHEETTENIRDEDMVTLEVAAIDSVEERDTSEAENKTGFLPFVPPSGIDFEIDYTFTAIGDDEDEDDEDYDINANITSDEMSLFPSHETTPSPRVTLKTDSWAFPVMIVGGSVLCLLIMYEVTVLFSISPPLPFTSHCLMVGLIMCSTSTMLLATSPTSTLCATTRLLLPLSYTIVFSCFLVKFIFLCLLSREQLLTTSYQIVMFLILIAVQLCVSCYLLVSSSPDVIITNTGVVCAASYEERLHGHLYNIIILSITVMMYLRYHQVRNIYIEAQYVGLTSLISGPVWLAWVVSGLSLDTSLQDLCSVLGLLVTVIITFVIMFVIIRFHGDSSGFADCYRQARKYEHFTIFPNSGNF